MAQPHYDPRSATKHEDPVAQAMEQFETAWGVPFERVRSSLNTECWRVVTEMLLHRAEAHKYGLSVVDDMPAIYRLQGKVQEDACLLNMQDDVDRIVDLRNGKATTHQEQA